METVALILARGGSKGIHKKNIRKIGGYPLIAYSIASALQSKKIDRVIVSTDDKEIAEIAENYGAEVPFIRPRELALDQTTDFPVIQHSLKFLNENQHYFPDLVAQIRPTSPLRPLGLIDRAIEKFQNNPAADSLRVISHPTQNPFKMWQRMDPEQFLEPMLKSDLREPYNMPRQELPEVFWQTGHLDIIRPEVIKEKGTLSGQNILGFEVNQKYCVDIDDLNSLRIAERILLEEPENFDWPNGNKTNRKMFIPKLLILDFDGVLTDNKVYVDQNGLESVCCDRSDGLAFGILKSLNIKTVILSKEQNPVVSARAHKLDIEVMQGVDNKLEKLREFSHKNQIPLSSVMYVGNDINDIDSMEAVGYSVAVFDAYPQVKRTADMILEKPGGRGAVRELTEKFLNQEGKELYG